MKIYLIFLLCIRTSVKYQCFINICYEKKVFITNVIINFISGIRDFIIFLQFYKAEVYSSIIINSIKTNTQEILINGLSHVDNRKFAALVLLLCYCHQQRCMLRRAGRLMDILPYFYQDHVTNLELEPDD